MTTMKIQGPAIQPGAPARSGFQPIPTRIRDVRESQGVPPLVVEPIADQQKQLIQQTLGELGTKLAEVHRTAAEAYLSQGLYEQSLPHLDAAATFAPTELEYHNQLGFVRYVLGDDAGAINAFNAVLAADPIHSEAWFNLAMVLFGQGQHGEAENCFRRSLDSAPNDAQAWNNRGVCCWQLQRKADAKTCFQRALQLDPSDQDAKFNLASIG